MRRRTGRRIGDLNMQPPDRVPELSATRRASIDHHVHQFQAALRALRGLGAHDLVRQLISEEAADIAAEHAYRRGSRLGRAGLQVVPVACPNAPSAEQTRIAAGCPQGSRDAPATTLEAAE